MSQREGSTVLCKLELHALSKKTVLKISLNPGLNLTIILGTGPCVINNIVFDLMHVTVVKVNYYQTILNGVC